MVEIERVIAAIGDKPLTVKEIAEKLNCTEDAVTFVLLVVTKRKKPQLYISVARGGQCFAYTTRKPIPSDPAGAST